MTIRKNSLRGVAPIDPLEVDAFETRWELHREKAEGKTPKVGNQVWGTVLHIEEEMHNLDRLVGEWMDKADEYLKQRNKLIGRVNEMEGELDRLRNHADSEIPTSKAFAIVSLFVALGIGMFLGGVFF